MGNCCGKERVTPPAVASGKGTLLVTDEFCLAGKAGGRNARLEALLDHVYTVVENDSQFAGQTFSSDVSSPAVVAALEADLARAHDKKYVKGGMKALRVALRSAPEAKIPVPGTGTSLSALRLRAMGGCVNIALRAVDSLLLPSNKQSHNVLGFTSNSGHCASRAVAPKGYNMFNAAAVAALYARARFGLDRVAVLDLDPQLARIEVENDRVALTHRRNLLRTSRSPGRWGWAVGNI